MVKAETIRNSVRLADVLARYGSPLNERGRALCPFHVDSRPSMTIKNERYKCWACGESGDAIDFVRGINGCGVQEAMEILNRDFSLGYNLQRGDTRNRANFDEIRQKKVKAYKEYLEAKKQQEIEDITRLRRVLYRAYVRGGCIDKEKEMMVNELDQRLDRLLGLEGGDEDAGDLH